MLSSSPWIKATDFVSFPDNNHLDMLIAVIYLNTADLCNRQYSEELFSLEYTPSNNSIWHFWKILSSFMHFYKTGTKQRFIDLGRDFFYIYIFFNWLITWKWGIDSSRYILSQFTMISNHSNKCCSCHVSNSEEKIFLIFWIFIYSSYISKPVKS